jgi:hypothetical protein
VSEGKGGGVWVVEWNEEDEVSKRMGRLRMALSMEERRKIMEKYLKAKYHKVPE